MNKDLEKYIKYIDGDLDENQKNEFEKELKSNNELKAQISNYQRSLKYLDGQVDSDERYFNNLILNSRNKQQKEKRNFKIAIGFTFAVVLLFVIILPNQLVEKNFSKELGEFIDENPNSEFDFYLSYDLESYDISQEELLEGYYDNLILSYESDYIDNLFPSDYYSLNLLDELNEDELDWVYENLKQINLR